MTLNEMVIRRESLRQELSILESEIKSNCKHTNISERSVYYSGSAFDKPWTDFLYSCIICESELPNLTKRVIHCLKQ